MANTSMVEELNRAAQERSLTPVAFRILPPQEADPILQRIEAHFVASPGRRWWWEDFRPVPRYSVHFVDGSGWRHLARIVPPETERAWFVVEGTQAEGFLLCDATVEAIGSVIGECYAFEYYVVSPDLDWLVGENHSDVIYAVGTMVADRLHEVAASLSEPQTVE